MKTFIALTSPPACGKTIWAQNFKKQHPNTFVVSADNLRIELYGKNDKRNIDSKLWEVFDNRIRECANQDLENLVVIADSHFPLNKYRVDLVKRHPEFDRYVLVIFTCLKTESLENNQNRVCGEACPEDVLLDIWDNFEKPDPETLEYYDEFIRVIGNYKRTNVNK